MVGVRSPIVSFFVYHFRLLIEPGQPHPRALLLWDRHSVHHLALLLVKDCDAAQQKVHRANRADCPLRVLLK